MKVVARILVVACLLAPLGCSKGDAQGIQGTWLVQSAEADGRPAPPDKIKDAKFVITADKIDMVMGDEKDEGTYKLDPSASPMAIDMTMTMKEVAKPFAVPGQPPPPEKVLRTETKTVQGIYSVEGDTLKICLASDGPRPKEFSGKSGQMLMVLKRAK